MNYEKITQKEAIEMARLTKSRFCLKGIELKLCYHRVFLTNTNANTAHVFDLMDVFYGASLRLRARPDV